MENSKFVQNYDFGSYWGIDNTHQIIYEKAFAIKKFKYSKFPKNFYYLNVFNVIVGIQNSTKSNPDQWIPSSDGSSRDGTSQIASVLHLTDSKYQIWLQSVQMDPDL